MHTSRTQHTSHLVELVHDLEGKLQQIENAPSTQAVSQLEQLAITTMQAIQVEANLVGYDLQDTVQAARKAINDRQTEATMQQIANQTANHRPTYDPLDRNANRRYRLSYSRQDGFNAHKVHDLYTGAPAPDPIPQPQPEPQPEQTPNKPEQTPNKPAKKPTPAKPKTAKKTTTKAKKTTKK